MEIRRAAQHRRMSWKNGGGETIEVAVFPEGASLDDFGWRVSMARVASDGPFSRFPGVERTLVVLDGILILAIDGVEVTLAAGAPCSFAGDVATSARLIAGPITDLNTMTRAPWRHTVRRIHAPMQLVGLTVVVARGPVVADGVELACDDAAIGATRLTAVTDAFVIELTPA